MLKKICLSSLVTLLSIAPVLPWQVVPALAGTVAIDRQQITANISTDMGQLLDWSQTDRRIEYIFFDNPERFRKSFVLATDGCKKDRCVNASILNISARPGGSPRSSFKVVLKDRLGRKHIYTVRLIKVKRIDDGVITFVPMPNSSYGSALGINRVQPIYVNRQR